MKCQVLFSWENISKCDLLNFLPRMQSVKVCDLALICIHSSYGDCICLKILQVCKGRQLCKQEVASPDHVFETFGKLVLHLKERVCLQA